MAMRQNSELEIMACKRFPLKFWVRPDTSDRKAIAEVIEKNSYQRPRKGFWIERGETWTDLGANIGAFSVLAASLGAKVRAYEADPDSYAILVKNIELNGFTDRIEAFQCAVVADHRETTELSVSEKNRNFWRNSVVKRWQGSRMVSVPCRHFESVTQDGGCVKMDIEGSEMPILEAWKFRSKKMVFEWSFDIDPDCDRFRAAMSNLKNYFAITDYKPIPEEVKRWPGEWFPAAMTIFCSQTRRGVSLPTP